MKKISIALIAFWLICLLVELAWTQLDNSEADINMGTLALKALVTAVFFVIINELMSRYGKHSGKKSVNKSEIA